MTVLAIAHPLPGATNEAFQRLRPEEIRAVWDIYRRGQIGQIYYCTDREVAVLLLTCGTIDEARGILADLPMVREGLIDWDYYPLGPFTPWDGLMGAAASAG
ncbi:MAG TPA: hypothetical protein PK694_00410 [Rhodospirillales bacterium]|jgi:hypothetical protein|nr:hypothetical protein [Rhodospirillales bacterium]